MVNMSNWARNRAAASCTTIWLRSCFLRFAGNLSLCLSHFLTHYTRSLFQPLSLSLTHTFTVSLSASLCPLSASLTLTQSLSLSASHSHTESLSLSLSLTHSLSLSASHSHTVSLSLSMPTHTRVSLSLSLSFQLLPPSQLLILFQPLSLSASLFLSPHTLLSLPLSSNQYQFRCPQFDGGFLMEHCSTVAAEMEEH